MSIITAHWSATSNRSIGEYHLEFGISSSLAGELSTSCKEYVKTDWHGLVHSIGAEKAAQEKSLPDVRGIFFHAKCFSFAQATDFGTYHLNHSPVDGSPNIEVGALCMGGEGVRTSGPWGNFPYTYAHFIMHAELIARICKLKGIDPLGSFPASIEPSVLQNGPIYNVSTHAERAIQTNDPDGKIGSLGYFVFSGDGDCRWDLAVPDVAEASAMSAQATAVAAAISNAAKLRAMAAVSIARGITDFWRLDA